MKCLAAVACAMLIVVGFPFTAGQMEALPQAGSLRSGQGA
jgi:hypothetical protein